MEKNKLIVGIIITLVLLIVGGVAAFYLMRPEKPTIARANLILDESIENSLALTSFTTKGNANFQVKSGEIVIAEVAMRDMQISLINPWDFAKQNSRMVGTYDIMMNLTAIADLIGPTMSPEKLDPDMFMGMDPTAILRAVGEANIAITMETKSINFDSYAKIIEITGLREIITSIGGAFLTEMIMKEIDPMIGVWHKTPATPETIKEMERMTEKIYPLMDIVTKTLPDILSVREVLLNTTVNDIAVYNFVVGASLEKTRDLVIALIPVVGEIIGKDAKEIAETKQDIVENWPKIVAALETTEIDGSTYISRETKFIIKEAGTVNGNLYHIMAALKPMIIENMTPEELAKFNEQKESIRDIRFVITGIFDYSNHNTVPEIVPPAKYEIAETGNGMF